MTNLLESRFATILALVLLFGGTACEKPEVSELGQPMTVGGVEFNVADFDVRYIELDVDGKTVEYPEPVLAITVEMTNQGEGAITYTPSHRSQQMSEGSTPLLYSDPGPEADLPPDSKQTINGVYLESGRLDEQISQSTSLDSGDSLTDIFLFEIPKDKEKSLILSLPPAMHRGNVPALFRIPYKYEAPEGPTIYQLGETVSMGSAAFTVEKAEIEYLKTNDTVQGEGYSSDPLLKISYKVENTGDQPLTYSPSHRDVAGSRNASLYTVDQTFRRVRFSATTKVEGQVNDDTDIKPGESVTDLTTFERPPEEIDTLTFEYPAHHFGGSGLVRVEIAYEYADPGLPDELKKAEKSEE